MSNEQIMETTHVIAIFGSLRIGFIYLNSSMYRVKVVAPSGELYIAEAFSDLDSAKAYIVARLPNSLPMLKDWVFFSYFSNAEVKTLYEVPCRDCLHIAKDHEDETEHFVVCKAAGCKCTWFDPDKDVWDTLV